MESTKAVLDKSPFDFMHTDLIIKSKLANKNYIPIDNKIDRDIEKLIQGTKLEGFVN